jgi:ribonuclease HI
MNKTTLEIIQYNVHRSKDVVIADFLRNPRVLEADVIAIQEPWENPYTETTHHPAKATHELVYPTSNECQGERTRVCMLISKQIGQWTHHAHGRDAQEVRIAQQGEQGELRNFNIYNPVGYIDTVMKLEDLFGRNIRCSMVVGDFNLHHPAWGGDSAIQDANADALIELTDSADLDLWLAPGTITRDEAGHQTTIDLVFGSHDLSERFLTSEIAHECHSHSDHLPIRTILDISTVSTTASAPKRRNWKAMETEKFDNFVAANLRGKTWTLTTPRQIDEAVEHFIDIINRAVEESTPWAKPSQYANPSFTRECRQAVKETRRLFRCYVATHSEEDWEVYKLARNQKGRVVKRALRAGFREFVKDAINQGPQGLWRMSKWARNRGQEQSSIMPPLKTADGIAESTDEKVQALREAFFPTPPIADLSDIDESSTRNRQQIPFPAITKQELADAIRRAPPNKAPGADGIPNKVWRLLAGESASQRAFLSTVLDIFNACLSIGHNPRHFQTSITVTLRKAGPRDYRLPKAYRPVALLNTLGKILEAIIATRIAWAVEEYRLLPDTHLGGRKGVSVDHAIQLILDRVHTAWGHGQGQKASMLLLDVAGAYDNVSHERLLHNMKQMGLSELVPWVGAFLTGRSTRIRLPGHLSDAFPTPTGIPQGSPISPILFLLFNAPLVKNCSLTTGYGRTEAFGWVDDVCILAVSNSYEENVWLIEKALQRADQWAKGHAARFAPDKFELIHYSNPRIEPSTIPPSPPSEYDVWAVPDDPCGHDQMPVAVPGGAPIQPSEHAKYLGIWLDKHLKFDIHRKRLLAKAAGSLEALRGISGSTWGASLMSMRKLYQAVIVPQALWGISAWYCPAARRMPAWEMARLVNELVKLQKRAAILISGAFKSISTAALDIELFLLPMKLRLQQSIEECAIRILTGPQWACPHTAKVARKPAERREGGWAPLEALVWKKGPLKMSKYKTNGADCAEKWEERVAFVLPPWERRISCFIEPSEAALATHDTITQQKRTQEGGETSLVYTDGSGFEGHIGAAAVNIDDGDTVISDRRHLGTESQSTVYAAELSGIEMALDRAIRDNKETPAKAREVILFSDSQAAIQAVQNPQRPSGQYVLKLLYFHVRTLRSQSTNITLRWIPAHVGVPGNEAADGNAKCAALEFAGGATDGADKPIIRLAAAAKRMVRERIQDRWKKQWESERTAQPTKRLVEWPSKKTLRLYECLSKPRSSIMIQMRSMRIALRHFLYKINEAESDKCPCGEGSQTPRHVLLQCETFGELRKRLFDQLHRAIGPFELSNYDIIVSNPLATRYVAKFMHQTGLLAQFQHADLEESDDEPDEDHEVMEQSPEDAGHYPMLANTVEGGENLDELFEYTVPDWAMNNRTPN